MISLKKTQNLILIAVIIILAVVFQLKYINEFPSFIHAWSQSDRYAIAIGFVNNNLDFFHPESYIMNPQFPGWWEIPYKTSITAVDFPINEYIIAIIMKLSGTTSPWIFRLFTLLYSLTGLFFLYKIARLLTLQFSKSILITFFAATSPVFIYYQSGFIPGIAALSNVTIGVWWYLKFIKNKENKYFYLTILFLTLAALIRMSFAIPLIAVLSFEFLRIIKKETNIIPKILPVFLSVLSVVGYIAWNSHLRKHYGSLFLDNLMYPDSMEHAKVLLLDTYYRWRFQYFSEIHYWIFLFLLLIATGFLVYNKFKFRKDIKPFNILSLWVFNGIWLLGCVLFSVAMLKQFPNHDYYFLDTFYLPLLFMFMLILKLIPDPENKKISIITGIFVFLLLISLIADGIKQQYSRRVYDANVCETISDFNNSAKFLDSLGVGKDAKILVINAYPQNTPFILMKRKGFILMFPNRDILLKSLKWDWDYIVFQNSYFFQEYEYNPDILSRFIRIADNGKITVCTLSDTLLDNTPAKFYDYDKKVSLFYSKINFDSLSDNGWFNIDITDKMSYSGNKSGMINPQSEWGTGYKSTAIHYFTESDKEVLFSGYFYSEKQINSCQIVFTIENEKGWLFHQTYEINQIIKPYKWNRVDKIFKIPKIDTKTGFFRLDIYCPGKHDKIYSDDFKIAFY